MFVVLPYAGEVTLVMLVYSIHLFGVDFHTSPISISVIHVSRIIASVECFSTPRDWYILHTLLCISIVQVSRDSEEPMEL